MEAERLLPGLNQQSFREICQKIFCGADNSREYAEAYEFYVKNGAKALEAKWLNPLLRPKVGLVIVDFQNDFIDGTLAISNGTAKQDPLEAMEILNALLKDFGIKFAEVVYSQDWHPENHISFHANSNQRKILSGTPALFSTVQFETGPAFNRSVVSQTLWPTHCVQNSRGAELHPNLLRLPSGKQVCKGSNPEVDSNSAFFDNNKVYATELDRILTEKGITHVLICGLAYDVCVAATAEDALVLGYRTAIIEDCSKGLDEAEIRKHRTALRRKGCAFINAVDVERILDGTNIPPEWTSFMPKNLR